MCMTAARRVVMLVSLVRRPFVPLAPVLSLACSKCRRVAPQKIERLKLGSMMAVAVAA